MHLARHEVAGPQNIRRIHRAVVHVAPAQSRHADRVRIHPAEIPVNRNLPWTVILRQHQEAGTLTGERAMVRAQLQRRRGAARSEHLGDRRPVMNHNFLSSRGPCRLPMTVRGVGSRGIVMESQRQSAIRIARGESL